MTEIGITTNRQGESFGLPVPTPEQRVKILLVDDTPENLVSLEAALDSLGEELVFARSGKEALRHLLDENFAAILLDVKMPDMDGFETAELIRSRPKSRHIPILFLTGYKNEEHLFRGYDLGAVDFLFKPIVPEVLRSKVAVFVELSRKAELLERQTKALQTQAAVLRKAEQQFRSLLEAAPDAMVICREDGLITLVNSRTETLFGHDRRHLIQRHIRCLVPDWLYEIGHVPDEDIAREGLTRVSHELDAVREDGSHFPVEISLSPLRVEGSVLITTAIRDITERRRAESERFAAEEQVRKLNAHLEQLNSNLEERVIARTEELLRSNDELAQFAYIASHDLQEPLRTVSLYTQLLARRHGEQLKGDAATFMSHIVANAQRMERLIGDILEFSRADARASEHFTTVQFDECLDDAIASLQSSIEETDAVIIRESLPAVEGDPMQLARLLLNLIGNSLRYRKPNVRPEIRIKAVRADSEWLFSMADNGIGVEPQYADKIFGIFKRLHGRNTPGTGMGLAICRKILSRHGGRIWLDPGSVCGATFLFTLPVRNDQADPS